MDAWEVGRKVLKDAVDYIDKELAPVILRLGELEKLFRIPGPPGEKGEKGIDGVNGKDGLPGVRGEKGEAGLNGKDGLPGPKGEKGDPGRDGNAGRDGVDGKDGQPGRDGINGKDGAQGQKGDRGEDGKSITIEDIRSVLEAEVAKQALELERRAQERIDKAIDRIPPPVNGKDGLPGRDGTNGKDGLNGRDGADGLHGKDGRDGFGFEDLEVVQVDERVVVLRFSRDGIVKDFSLSFPTLIDRGVYKPEGRYKHGDGVTYAGSFWIAQKDSPEGRPGDSHDWRLAVKAGRNAKETP